MSCESEDNPYKGIPLARDSVTLINLHVLRTIQLPMKLIRSSKQLGYVIPGDLR
jgi:hypothetical protein